MATQTVPPVKLPHVAQGEVSLADLRGKTFVLVFAGRNSGDQAEGIFNALRDRYPADLLPIVQIANLKGVPRLMQGLAKRDISKAYDSLSKKESSRLQAAGKLVPDDLSRNVVLLLDWEGTLATSLGLSDIDKTAIALLVDGDAQVCGVAKGAGAGVGSSRVDLQACKLEYSIVSPK